MSLNTDAVICQTENFYSIEKELKYVREIVSDTQKFIKEIKGNIHHLREDSAKLFFMVNKLLEIVPEINSNVINQSTVNLNKEIINWKKEFKLPINTVEDMKNLNNKIINSPEFKKNMVSCKYIYLEYNMYFNCI